MEGLKKQLEGNGKWSNSDKCLMSQIYSIKDLSKFLTSDFELIENNNEIFIQKSNFLID